ncbi:MAG: hypothetical protein CR965_00375 [Paludibacter sp.]|nr:MAG: hypothetical protein CR965_00375 [Paludibacter sp.]
MKTLKKSNYIRFHLLFFFTFNVLLIFGQTSSNNNYIIEKGKGGTVQVLIFDKIDNNTEIKYTGNASNIKWYEYKDGTSAEITNLKNFYPENNKGYMLKANGKKTLYWVFDYSQYTPIFSDLNPIKDNISPCESVNIDIKGNIPTFIYQDLAGNKMQLKRKFKINYTTLTWKNQEWIEKDTTQTIVLPTKNKIVLPTPLTITTFKLSGDSFSEKLNLQPTIITSSSFVPSAVKTKIITTTTTREALNENNRPSQTTQLDGSAPLEILFTALSTSKVTNHIWKIFKDKELILSRNVDEHKYTFTEAGNYKVQLLATNNQCTDSTSVEIAVSESQIHAPSVFTPNNDGKNDEFRVAYQSIVEFEGTIINRWGRVLFKWDNPEKGWDGKVNGKSVSEGTYFYIINAKGSDGKKYKLKGHINLFR